MPVSGTLRKVLLNGDSFDIPPDVDVSEMGGPFEVEMLPSTGKNMKKMTRRTETRENVVLFVDAAQRDVLRALSAQVETFPMSYQTADGTIYRCTGAIEFPARTTADNRATINMLPEGIWDTFLA